MSHRIPNHNAYTHVTLVLLLYSCSSFMYSSHFVSATPVPSQTGTLVAWAADHLTDESRPAGADESSVSDVGAVWATDGPAQNATLYDARARVNHPNTTSSGDEKWRQVANGVELVLACSGVTVNVITIVALWSNRQGFSLFTATLLKHQAFLDAIVCGMGASVFIQRSDHWKIGNYYIDAGVCYIWHSQYIYWAWVLLSVWNLIFIAVDRLLAVCYPMFYKGQTMKKLYTIIAVMYIPCLMSPIPSAFDVNFLNGTCVEDNGKNKIFSEIFAIFWALVAYVVPVSLFLIFYGRIILTLRRKRMQVDRVVSVGQGRNNHRLTVVSSSLRVTKCAITVTFIFIVTVCYDSMFYLISNTVDSVTYDLGSPAQLTGIMLMTVNSLSNPLMYAMFLPAFRRTIGTLLTSGVRRGDSVRGSGTSQTSSSCAWRSTRRVAATSNANNGHSFSGTSFSETRTNSTNSYGMAGVQGEGGVASDAPAQGASTTHAGGVSLVGVSD